MLLWDGGVRAHRIDAHRFVEIVVRESRRRCSACGRAKGTIAVGSDGDLVIWDPNRTVTLSAKTHHMRVDYNPYEGRVVTRSAVDGALARRRDRRQRRLHRRQRPRPVRQAPGRAAACGVGRVTPVARNFSCAPGVPMTPSTSSTEPATIGHWIDGQPWTGEASRYGDVYNPARGEQTARVAFADAAVVDAAVKAASDAARAWGRTSLAARSRILFAFRELVERRKRDLAEILT